MKTKKRPNKRVQNMIRESTSALTASNRAFFARFYLRARLAPPYDGDGEVVAIPRARARRGDHMGMWGPTTGYVYWRGVPGRGRAYRRDVGAGWLRSIGGQGGDGIVIFDATKVSASRLACFMRGRRRAPKRS